MRIKLRIDGEDAFEIINLLKRKYSDYEFAVYTDFEMLKPELHDDFDILIISYVKFDETFKNRIRLVSEEIKKGVRVIVLNLSGAEMQFEEYGYLMALGIDDYSKDKKLKATLLYELIEKPKKTLLSLEMNKSSEKKQEVETIIVEKVVDRVIKVRQGGITAFYGVQGTGISTAALYFSKKLAQSLSFIGDKNSKVLLVEMNHINPKLRHYLSCENPSASIEHMALSIQNVKDKKHADTNNLNAIEFVQMPIEELDNFYFLDSIYGINEGDYIDLFHLKHIVDHLKNLFDFIVFSTNGDVSNTFTSLALNESNKIFLSLDMNFANLDRLKRILKTKESLHKKMTPIFNKYQALTNYKFEPSQYADALEFSKYFVLPYENELIEKTVSLAGRSSKFFIDDDSEYVKAIGKLVDLYVEIPNSRPQNKSFISKLMRKKG